MSNIDKSIKVYNIVNGLKGIKRQGWVNRQIPGRLESVAEHCFAMTNLAILINLEHNLNLDMAKVLTMINIHEYGETIAGDITPKDGISKEEKYNKEMKAILEVMGDHPGKTTILELWKEFEAKSTPETIFVSLLDKFKSVLQAKEYSKKFNRIDIYNEFVDYYQKILEDMNKNGLSESARFTTFINVDAIVSLNEQNG